MCGRPLAFREARTKFLGYAHHRRVTFQDEFRSFLKKYEIEYDERYVWD